MRLAFLFAAICNGSNTRFDERSSVTTSDGTCSSRSSCRISGSYFAKYVLRSRLLLHAASDSNGVSRCHFFRVASPSTAIVIERLAISAETDTASTSGSSVSQACRYRTNLARDLGTGTFQTKYPSAVTSSRSCPPFDRGRDASDATRVRRSAFAMARSAIARWSECRLPRRLETP